MEHAVADGDGLVAGDDDFDGVDPSELLISRYGDRSGAADAVQRFDEEEASWLAEASMFTPAECPEPPPRTERFTSPTIKHRFGHHADSRAVAASSRQYALDDDDTAIGADDSCREAVGSRGDAFDQRHQEVDMPEPPTHRHSERPAAAAAADHRGTTGGDSDLERIMDMLQRYDGDDADAGYRSQRSESAAAAASLKTRSARSSLGRDEAMPSSSSAIIHSSSRNKVDAQRDGDDSPSRRDQTPPGTAAAAAAAKGEVFSSIRDIYRTIEAVRDAPKARFDSRTGRLFATPPPSTNTSTRSSSVAGAGGSTDRDGKDSRASVKLPTPCAFRASVLHHERRTLRAYCRKFTTPRIPVSVASMSASGTLGKAEPLYATAEQRLPPLGEARSLSTLSAHSNHSAFAPASAYDAPVQPAHPRGNHGEWRAASDRHAASSTAVSAASGAERRADEQDAASAKAASRRAAPTMADQASTHHHHHGHDASSAATSMTPEQKRRLVERLLRAEGGGEPVAGANAPMRPAATRPRDRSIL